MKKILTLSAILLMLFTTPVAFSAPNEHLDWGAQLHSGTYACPGGTPIVNIVQRVINSVDSGTGSNYWAYDDFVRQIQVVQTGSSAFCASVSYQGNFTTIEGRSPGFAYTGGSIGEGVVGTFQGGYTAIFTATLKSSPLARKKGSIGTYDYQCDELGNCPGWFDWTSLYFDGVAGFDQPWWGWIYHAGNNGSWTNASSGNSGDITGN